MIAIFMLLWVVSYMLIVWRIAIADGVREECKAVAMMCSGGLMLGILFFALFVAEIGRTM